MVQRYKKAYIITMPIVTSTQEAVNMILNYRNTKINTLPFPANFINK